ncbi:MAG: hypothetical protein JWP89_4244 [Schlesneria sp.]|nr:hypothetical protein [Schlesneria sp.]
MDSDLPAMAQSSWSANAHSFPTNIDAGQYPILVESTYIHIGLRIYLEIEASI